MNAYGGRRSRQAFDYDAYVPPRVGEMDFSFAGDIAAVLGEADQNVRDLNREPPPLGSFENLARQLLRAESVASSRIEGLELSHRRLAHAAFAPDDARDVNAQSVLGNMRAMEEAIELGGRPGPIRVEDIQRIHDRLLADTRDAHLAGRIRTTQNWVGGGLTPRDAEFIPPPPELVIELLGDLCDLANRDDLPPVAQAALVHAQFETIHPFADGNGRVGRCLIHVVLRHRALAPRYVPPISLVLATDARAYIAGLTEYRRGGYQEWCGTFAAAVRKAAQYARRFAGRVEELVDLWRVEAGDPRKDSAASRILANLPAHPVLDIETGAVLANVSGEAARQALHALEAAGVVRRTNLGGRRHAWEAIGLFEMVNEFERALATPSGASEPVRRVPRPPQRG